MGQMRLALPALIAFVFRTISAPPSLSTSPDTIGKDQSTQE
jgi:hypothetical protein